MLNWLDSRNGRLRVSCLSLVWTLLVGIDWLVMAMAMHYSELLGLRSGVVRGLTIFFCDCRHVRMIKLLWRMILCLHVGLRLWVRLWAEWFSRLGNLDELKPISLWVMTELPLLIRLIGLFVWNLFLIVATFVGRRDSWVLMIVCMVLGLSMSCLRAAAVRFSYSSWAGACCFAGRNIALILSLVTVLVVWVAVVSIIGTFVVAVTWVVLIPAATLLRLIFVVLILLTLMFLSALMPRMLSTKRVLF